METCPSQWRSVCTFWGGDLKAIMTYMYIFAQTVDEQLLTTEAKSFTNVDVMTRRFLYLLVRPPKSSRIVVVNNVDVFYTSEMQEALSGVFGTIAPAHRHLIWMAAAMNGLAKAYMEMRLYKQLFAISVETTFHVAYMDLMPSLLNVRWMVARHYGTDQIFIEPHPYDDDYDGHRQKENERALICSIVGKDAGESMLQGQSPPPQQTMTKKRKGGETKTKKTKKKKAKREEEEEEEEAASHGYLLLPEVSSNCPSAVVDWTEPMASLGIEVAAEFEYTGLDLDFDFDTGLNLDLDLDLPSTWVEPLV